MSRTIKAAGRFGPFDDSDIEYGMLSSDEAIAIGCRRYRELYPKGMIPPQLEEQGVLGATPGDAQVLVYITFWFEGDSEPFYLFRASVDRSSGIVSVDKAEDWHQLENKTFDTSQNV